MPKSTLACQFGMLMVNIEAVYSQHFGLALSLGIRSKSLTVQEKTDFEHWSLSFNKKKVLDFAEQNQNNSN